MRERLQERLTELRNEFAIGENKLQELDRQTMQLRETLLRISGAIRVLDELLAESQAGQELSSTVKDASA